MTTSELVNTLNSGANSIDMVKSMLPSPVNVKITALLIQVRDNLLPPLLPIIQAMNPDMTDTELLGDLNKAISALQSLKAVMEDGSLDKAEAFMRNLEGRPIILAIIANRLSEKE